jgi:hypothetical protein
MTRLAGDKPMTEIIAYCGLTVASPIYLQQGWKAKRKAE